MRIFWIVSGLLLSFSASAEITDIAIDLPKGVRWLQVTDQSAGQAYLKEWVPSGKSADNTDWIIVQQRFVLKKKATAKKYIGSMLKLSRGTCTDVKLNGPEKRELQGRDSYWARLMCAQILGKDYGTFTEIRVIADGMDVYVVTSEVHLPPTSVAGVFNFSDPSKIQETMQRFEASALVVRESVRLCPVDGC